MNGLLSLLVSGHALQVCCLCFRGGLAVTHYHSCACDDGTTVCPSHNNESQPARPIYEWWTQSHVSHHSEKQLFLSEHYNSGPDLLTALAIMQTILQVDSMVQLLP